MQWESKLMTDGVEGADGAGISSPMCWECDYLLVGLGETTLQCPECGAVVSPVSLTLTSQALPLTRFMILLIPLSYIGLWSSLYLARRWGSFAATELASGLLGIVMTMVGLCALKTWGNRNRELLHIQPGKFTFKGILFRHHHDFVFASTVRIIPTPKALVVLLHNAPNRYVVTLPAREVSPDALAQRINEVVRHPSGLRKGLDSPRVIVSKPERSIKAAMKY